MFVKRDLPSHWKVFRLPRSTLSLVEWCGKRNTQAQLYSFNKKNKLMSLDVWFEAKRQTESSVWIRPCLRLVVDWSDRLLSPGSQQLLSSYFPFFLSFFYVVFPTSYFFFCLCLPCSADTPSLHRRLAVSNTNT